MCKYRPFYTVGPMIVWPALHSSPITRSVALFVGSPRPRPTWGQVRSTCWSNWLARAGQRDASGDPIQTVKKTASQARKSPAPAMRKKRE